MTSSSLSFLYLFFLFFISAQLFDILLLAGVGDFCCLMSHQMLSFIDERRRRRRRTTLSRTTTTTTTTKGERERAWEEVPAERASKRERERLEREKERERFFNGESKTFVLRVPLQTQKGAKYERQNALKTRQRQERIRKEEEEGRGKRGIFNFSLLFVSSLFLFFLFFSFFNCFRRGQTSLQRFFFKRVVLCKLHAQFLYI